MSSTISSRPDPAAPNPANPGFLQNLRDLPRAMTAGAFANALAAWLFGSTGPLLIVLAAAQAGNLPQAQVVSWVGAVYFGGGVISILLSLLYRLPIAGAHTIPAAVLVGTALLHLPLNEVVGAYWLSGVVIILLGTSGLVRRVMDWLPMPIMMGMVTAVLLPFGLGIIRGLEQAPLLGGITVAAFLLFSLAKGLRVPPVLAAIVVGLAAATLLGEANWATFSFDLARPIWIAPAFTVAAGAELVIPLVLMVIATQNSQGFAAMKAAGYQPPVTAITVSTGIGTMAYAAFGGHPACIAGPMTAIIASPSSGPLSSRYSSGVILGAMWLVFGLLAPAAAAITQIIPASLVYLLGGLALAGPLAQFFHQAFGGRYRMGSLVAFLTTASGVTIFQIAAPFWALVAGTLVSLALERSDFNAPR